MNTPKQPTPIRPIYIKQIIGADLNAAKMQIDASRKRIAEAAKTQLGYSNDKKSAAFHKRLFDLESELNKLSDEVSKILVQNSEL